MRRKDGIPTAGGSGMRFALPLLASFFAAVAAPAAEGRKPDASVEPINITSSQLDADQRVGKIVFKGDVVARQQAGTIMSDLLTVTYDENNNIRLIVAENNVKIDQEGRVATCNKATFYPVEKKVVMEGSPRVWKEGDIVSGEVITIFLDSDRMDVEGVEAVIHPKKKEGEESALSERGK